MRPVQNRPLFRQMVIPPFLFADMVSKVVITPDTPTAMINELEKAGIKADTQVSKRQWNPNPHMEAYNRRKEMRKREKSLGS